MGADCTQQNMVVNMVYMAPYVLACCPLFQPPHSVLAMLVSLMPLWHVKPFSASQLLHLFCLQNFIPRISMWPALFHLLALWFLQRNVPYLLPPPPNKTKQRHLIYFLGNTYHYLKWSWSPVGIFFLFHRLSDSPRAETLSVSFTIDDWPSKVPSMWKSTHPRWMNSFIHSTAIVRAPTLLPNTVLSFLCNRCTK